MPNEEKRSNQSALLEDAELLLGFAARSGVAVEDGVRDAVLRGKAAKQNGNWSQESEGGLLWAVSMLAAKVKPVTPESLRDSREAHREMVALRLTAMVLGIIILLISFCTFVSNHLLEKITADVATANGLATKLSAELGPPPSHWAAIKSGAAQKGGATNPDLTDATNAAPDEARWGHLGAPRGLTEKDVISDLQLFAATMREIDGYSSQLRPFVLNLVPDSDVDVRTNGQLQLTPGLTRLFSEEFELRVTAYQTVRDFGDDVTQAEVIYYGAVASCLLPVLYALLGAVAYLLRTSERQIRDQTFVCGSAQSGRYLIAAIGGIVIGLFNFGKSVSVPPLAAAFLVGYAVDFFFAYLDRQLERYQNVLSQNAASREKSSAEVPKAATH